MPNEVKPHSLSFSPLHFGLTASQYGQFPQPVFFFHVSLGLYSESSLSSANVTFPFILWSVLRQIQRGLALKFHYLLQFLLVTLALFVASAVRHHSTHK